MSYRDREFQNNGPSIVIQCFKSNQINFRLFDFKKVPQLSQTQKWLHDATRWPMYHDNAVMRWCEHFVDDTYLIDLMK